MTIAANLLAGLGTGTIVVIAIVAVVVIFLLWLVSGRNSFVQLKNKVEEAFSTMDVYLKKRYDLIPNLVETVKGYCQHESGTLESVIAARNAAMSAGTIDEKAASDAALTGTLKTLFALAEAYPELKADASFQNLQSQLSSIEGEIAQARKYYNGVVREFNTKREMFPSNIIGAMFGFKTYPFFAADESERENVKVSF